LWWLQRQKQQPKSQIYKRQRNKFNSMARELRLEHAFYNDETVMRFAAISDQINNVDKDVESLRLDMQAAIHNEFMYLLNKMLLTKPKQQQQLLDKNDSAAAIDYGGRS
jgi:hypothetical protein